MRGLSIITNFEKSNPMFGLQRLDMTKIKSDIDFDYIEFLVGKYSFSKLAVSGGTDPMSNVKKRMNLEILRKIALDNKLRFLIYTKEDLSKNLDFLKYLHPSRVVVYNHLVSDKKIEEIAKVSQVCPLRMYILYNNQHPVYINLWAQHFNKVQNIEFSVKQNRKIIKEKDMGSLNPNIFVIPKGNHNHYLMPDNFLYEDFSAKLKIITKYVRNRLLK